MLKIGILGAGRAAAAHADGITRSGLGQVVKIYAPGDGASIAPRYGARPTSSPEEIVNDPAVDAVVIAAPTDRHLDAARAAVGSGKHLMCEVPVVRTGAEAEDLRKLTAGSNSTVMAAALTCRYDPAVVHLKKSVEAGDLGTVGTVRLGRLDAFRAGADNWYADFGRSGGVVLDSLPSMLDAVRFCFGEIERIHVMRSPQSGDLRKDYALVAGRLRSGALLHLELSWAETVGSDHFYYEIAGSDGILEYDTRIEPKLDIQSKTGEPIQYATASEAMNPRNPAAVTPHQSLATDFLQSIREGRSPAATLQDALTATEMALKAL